MLTLFFLSNPRLTLLAFQWQENWGTNREIFGKQHGMNDHRWNTNLVWLSRRGVELEEERIPLQSNGFLRCRTCHHSLGQTNFVSYAELVPPSVQPVHRDPRETLFFSCHREKLNLCLVLVEQMNNLVRLFLEMLAHDFFQDNFSQPMALL